MAARLRELRAMFDDIRYALRSLRVRPALALVAILTIAIGIGANVSIFGIINALLLRPVPGIANMDRLVAIYGVEGGSEGVSAWADLADYRQQSKAFRGLAGFKNLDIDLETGQDVERVKAALVSRDYFDVVGVQPALGRFFVDDEHRVPDAVAVAVLSHDVWQTRFGGGANVIDRNVRINGRPFRVVGVAPPRFRGTMVSDVPAVYVPFMMLPHLMPGQARLLESRGWSGMWMIGRLADGASVRTAQASLDVIARRLAAQYRDNGGRRAHVVPLREAMLPPGVRATVVRIGSVAMIAVNLLLVLVCANLALLMLMRGASRSREMAMRKALGSSTVRLIRQLLTESAILGAAGAVAGLFAARWVASLLNRLPIGIPLNISIDDHVIVFTVVLTAITIALFGTIPALAASRTSIHAILKREAGRGLTRSRTGVALVSLQVALSAALLFVSGLLIRTVMMLRADGLGYDPRGVVVATITPNADNVQLFYDELFERLRARPEITHAGASTQLPLSGDEDRVQVYRGEDPDGTSVAIALVRDGFFESLRMPILRGRSLAFNDAHVVLVNEALAAKFWPGRDPIGKRVRSSKNGPWFTVIGVVGDGSLQDVRKKGIPYMFIPHRQVPIVDMGRQLHFFVRGRVAEAELMRILTATIHSLDAHVPIVGLASLQERMDSFVFHERLLRWIVFGRAVPLSRAANGLADAGGGHTRDRGAGSRSELRARATRVDGGTGGGVAGGVAVSSRAQSRDPLRWGIPRLRSG